MGFDIHRNKYWLSIASVSMPHTESYNSGLQDRHKVRDYYSHYHPIHYNYALECRQNSPPKPPTKKMYKTQLLGNSMWSYYNNSRQRLCHLGYGYMMLE